MKYSLTHHLNSTPEGIRGGLPLSETEEIEIDARSWESAVEIAAKLFAKICVRSGPQFTCSATLWAWNGRGLQNKRVFLPA